MLRTPDKYTFIEEYDGCKDAKYTTKRRRVDSVVGTISLEAKEQNVM